MKIAKMSVMCPIEVNRLLNFQNYMQETGKYASLNAALQMTVSARAKLVQPIVKELKNFTLHLMKDLQLNFSSKNIDVFERRGQLKMKIKE
jgi:hypothetical protein